jgi:SAM-dependent methyltransferase
VTTESDGERDPVLDSVAAYSPGAQSYADHYATRMLDRPRRFATALPPSSAILDLGCGPGRDLRIFSECGHQPIGLELNPDFVEMAREQGEVVLGDIREVSTLFEPASFHGVWAQASLVHLAAEETELVLRHIHGLLVPGGRFYACVSATGRTGWLDEPDGRRWYTVWPEGTFPDALTAAGFAVTEIVQGPYIEVWAERGHTTSSAT